MSQIIEVVQTARDTRDRLTPQNGLFLSQDGVLEALPLVAVETQTKYQEIIGFGGAFTESAAFVVAHMSPEKRAEMIAAYFEPGAGIGYSVCRTHMNSCDFSLGNYSCDDVAGDYELRHFTIDRDRRYLIPFIKSALEVKGEPFKLFISPWSPPGWMKTNHQMNQGGQLRDDCKEAWALFFAKFIKAYETEAGIPVWGLTVQNEPDVTQTWDSCRYSGAAERDFVRDYLGPGLQREGLGDKKIIVWDHNRDLLYERAREILTDPRAAQYVWGIGFHWYSGTDFENVARTHQAFPAQKLLLTEGCWEDGVKLGQWDRGERYGHHIIGDLSHWANGWVDWNMVLDPTGGPNHAGNLCDAPIIADPVTDAVHYQSSYYYLGHFSKFIQPGAYRVASHCSEDRLETAAFENPDGSVVTIVLNRSDREYEFGFRIGSGSTRAKSLAHSILTLIKR